MLDSLPLILPWRPTTVCTMMLAASQLVFSSIYQSFWLAEFHNSMINRATQNSKFNFILKTNSLLITYQQCLFNLLKINLSLHEIVVVLWRTFVSTLFATLLRNNKNYRDTIVPAGSSASPLWCHQLLSKVTSISRKPLFDQLATATSSI